MCLAQAEMMEERDNPTGQMARAARRTACLGPQGTYSWFAARTLLGDDAPLILVSDLGSLFRHVTEGLCGAALVPLENSLRGSVGLSFDLFLRHDVRIVAECYAGINNCLLSRAKNLDAIRLVYSHPQPLAQCSEWLARTLPKARLAATSSTAEAARLAAELESAAALGHRKLGELYGLSVLADEVEDGVENRTRFVLIERAGWEADSLPRGDGFGAARAKSSLLLTLPDRPGTLAGVLNCLASAGINMRKIESRPLSGEARAAGQWQYAFFIDVENDMRTGANAEAMAMLRSVCASCRLLGCYAQGPALETAERD